MLTLPIKKKWFDMIKSGEKKEEYREIKPYYDSRFSFTDDGITRTYEVRKWIIFRNGYKKGSPKIKCWVSIKEDYGKPEWGAELNKLYYVLKILSIEEVEE